MKATKEFFESLRTEVSNEVEISLASQCTTTIGEKKSAPSEVLEQHDKETEGENYYKEIIQQLEDAKQREIELREALEMERKRHESADGVERLPITSFIEYAEHHYPADQNKSAKILKEAILDLYDRCKISDEDYERCKLLGTKETPVSNVSVGAGGINVQHANNVGK